MILYRWFLLVLLCCSGISASALAADREFLILGTPEEPFKMEENGRITGVDVDVVRAVLEALEVPYSIRLINSGSRIISEMKSGRADMVLSFSRAQDREHYLIFPEQSYKDVSWHFFIRSENREAIRYSSFEDLKGLRIGVTQDWAYTREFWDAGLDYHVVTNNEFNIRKLLKSRIDLVPLNTVSALYRAKQQGYRSQITYLPKALKSKPYFNAFSIASDHPLKDAIIRQYDTSISAMKKDGRIQAIYDRYLD